MTEQPGRYRLPPSTDKAFRAFVRGRHGDDFKKGHYMEEANKAILRYISLEKISNTHTHAYTQHAFLRESLKAVIRCLTIS